MDEKLFNFVPVVTSLWSDFSDNNPKELLFRSVWSNLCMLKSNWKMLSSSDYVLDELHAPNNLSVTDVHCLWSKSVLNLLWVSELTVLLYALRTVLLHHSKEP